MRPSPFSRISWATSQTCCGSRSSPALTAAAGRSWEEPARAMLLKARHDFVTGGQDTLLRALIDEIFSGVPQA